MLQNQTLEQLENLSIKAMEYCPLGSRAGALAERASFRAQRGLRPQAVADYAEAYKLVADPRYLLEQAETRLVDGESAAVLSLLADWSKPSDSCRSSLPEPVRAAYYLWLTTEQERYAQLLLFHYRCLPEGRPGLAADMGQLTSWACRDPASQRCQVLDVLSGPRNGDSPERLRQLIPYLQPAVRQRTK